MCRRALGPSDKTLRITGFEVHAACPVRQDAEHQARVRAEVKDFLSFVRAGGSL